MTDKVDYVAALDRNALIGAHIGVMRAATAPSLQVDALIEQALSALRAAGAKRVDVKAPEDAQKTLLSSAEGEALRTEFRIAIDAYVPLRDAWWPRRSRLPPERSSSQGAPRADLFAGD